MATKTLLAQLSDRLGAAVGGIEFDSAGGVEVARRIRDGEQVDLVVLASDAVATLARDGLLRLDSVRPLFVSEVVVAVPESAADLDISSPVLLDAAFTAAARIGYSTGPSGEALLQLLEDRGLRPELDDRLVQAEPGVPVAQLLTDGRADLGVQQRSEFAGVAGVRVLGPLPGKCAVTTSFVGAVTTASARPAEAAAILALLGDSTTAEVVRANGMQPAPA